MKDEIVFIGLKWSTICKLRTMLAKKAYTASRKYDEIDKEITEAVKQIDLSKVKEAKEKINGN